MFLGWGYFYVVVCGVVFGDGYFWWLSGWGVVDWCGCWCFLVVDVGGGWFV